MAAKKKVAKKKAAPVTKLGAVKSKVSEIYGKIPSSVKTGIVLAASAAAGAYGGPMASQGAGALLKLLGAYLAG